MKEQNRHLNGHVSSQEALKAALTILSNTRIPRDRHDRIVKPLAEILEIESYQLEHIISANEQKNNKNHLRNEVAFGKEHKK